MSAVVSFGTAWIRSCSASWAMRWACARLSVGIDVEFGVGVQVMPDPAHPYAAHRADTGTGGERRFGGVDELRLHAVQQATEHIADRGAEHGQDRHRDDQPDDRVGEREPQCDATGGEQHGQRGETVCAGMQSVGDEGGGPDLASDPDAVQRDQFVADEADQSGRATQPRCSTG